MYVCMYSHVFACCNNCENDSSECVYVYMCICIYVCMYSHVFVCCHNCEYDSSVLYMCMYVCMYVSHVYACFHNCEYDSSVCVCVCIYIYIYIYILYVYIHTHICIYIYIYIICIYSHVYACCHNCEYVLRSMYMYMCVYTYINMFFSALITVNVYVLILSNTVKNSVKIIRVLKRLEFMLVFWVHAYTFWRCYCRCLLHLHMFWLHFVCLGEFMCVMRAFTYLLSAFMYVHVDAHACIVMYSHHHHFVTTHAHRRLGTDHTRIHVTYIHRARADCDCWIVTEHVLIATVG